MMGAKLLDGRSLAARRLPAIAEAAAQVRARRGRRPRLLLVAFATDDGTVQHVGAKLRACAAAGVEAIPLLFDSGCTTSHAVEAMQAAIAAAGPDAVFVQVPIPSGLDEAAIVGAIPPAADCDVMTAAAFASYMGGAASQAPPITVSAALQLLDAGGIDVCGMTGVVVAEASPFALMLGEALKRRGARMQPLLDPSAADWKARLAGATLAVAAAGRPGIISSGDLAAGAVALDIGYFNEGGRGDIDVSAGSAHLSALMPVPGGVGPMTVSVLLERVVELSAPAP